MKNASFNLSCVTLAFAAGAAAESTLDSLCAEMMTWHKADTYPDNSSVALAITEALPHLAKGTIKTYSSALLKWAKSGKQPRSLSAMVKMLPEGHKKSAAGRKAKVTKTAADTVSEDKASTTIADLLLSAQGIRAGLTKITASMIVADALDAYIACLRMEAANVKK